MVLRNRPRVGVSLVLRLRLADRAEGSGHVVDMLLDGGGPQRSASVRFGFELTARDREDLRWYLEDYLQYPVDPAPEIAHGVEARLAALGEVLFGQVFRASMETAELWLAVRESLALSPTRPWAPPCRRKCPQPHIVAQFGNFFPP